MQYNNIDLTAYKTQNAYTIFNYTEDEIINYYNEIGLFMSDVCKHCGSPMTKRNELNRHYTSERFYCKICHLIVTRRSGTIFEGMKIPFKAFNLILYYFAEGFTTREIFRLLQPLIGGISHNTIKKYTKSFRFMVHIYVQSIISDAILPGPVEIDEACCYKLRRGNHGRLARTIYWIFGLKCRTTKKVIIYPVLYRNRVTIIPIIQKHVKPGTIIYSDMFSCYFNNRRNPPQSYLANFGYIHYGVNHSIEFVSSIDASIHTNTIERVWRGLKGKLRDYKPKKYINEYISEYILESWIQIHDRYFFLIHLLHYFHQE